MTSERRRLRAEQENAAQAAMPADDRSGWAHYQRTGAAELRFVEWCPDRFGRQGGCRYAGEHAWRSSPAAKARLRARGIAAVDR